MTGAEVKPWTTVAATGPREVPDGAEPWVRAELLRHARWLAEGGTRYAISGMARCVDLWWADAAAQAGLALCAAIPFEEQPARWSKADRAEWDRLRGVAARECIVGKIPDGLAPKQRSAAVNRLLHARNDFMLDRSHAVVAVWPRRRFDGGTHSALVKADRRGMPGVWLDPAAGTVTYALPTAADLTGHALTHAGCGHVACVDTAADVEILRSTFQTAGLHGWQIRRSRPRETATSTCPTCDPPGE